MRRLTHHGRVGHRPGGNAVHSCTDPLIPRRTVENARCTDALGLRKPNHFLKLERELVVLDDAGRILNGPPDR